MTKDINLHKLRENMKNESIDDKIKAAATAVLREQEDKKAFLYTKKCDKLLRDLTKKGPEYVPFEDYNRLCETVLLNHENQMIKERKAEFPTYHIDYKGIRFGVTIGQGSVYWTEKL